MNHRATAIAIIVLAGAGAHAQDDTTRSEAADYLKSFEGAAPPRLVLFGHYSDRRFIDMMVPHHAMAVEMARMALERSQHDQLRALAQSIVDSQSAEIDEMRAIKQANFGTDRVPAKMNPVNVENMGMLTMTELAQAPAFDCAFLASMIPHHAAAIPMASVVLRHGEALPALQSLSRAIVSAQAHEIGQMEAWRASWCDDTP